jgi:hypothetical protein
MSDLFAWHHMAACFFVLAVALSHPLQTTFCTRFSADSSAEQARFLFGVD